MLLPWRSATSHESCKKYPNFCEKFPSYGSHSARTYSSGKRNVHRMWVEKFSPCPTESLKKHSYIYLTALESDRRGRNVFWSSGSVNNTRTSDTLTTAKSFPLLYGWLQRDYPRKRSLTSHLIARSFRSVRVAFTAHRRLSHGSQVWCTLQNEILCEITARTWEKISGRIGPISHLFLWQEHLRQSPYFHP